MADRINPRTQRVRDALKSATIELVSKKPVSEISITEIAITANVSRPSVYKQFNDLPTLVADTTIGVMNGIFADIDKNLKVGDDLEYLNKHMEMLTKGLYKHRKFLKNAIYSSAEPIIIDAAVKDLCNRMRDRLVGRTLVEAGMNVDDCLHAIAAGMVLLTFRWLNSDFRGENSPTNMGDRIAKTIFWISGVQRV